MHYELIKSAFRSTCKSAFWLLKLMIPISLTVTLLQYWGVIEWLAQWLNPVFRFMGLPGSSAVLFLSGAAAGTYAGIAAMMSIPLTLRQATIIGLMILICHALPMECAVNRKTGSSFWGMAALRIFMAFVCAFYMNQILPDMPQAYLYMGAPADSGIQQVLLTWVISQAKMSVMIFCIIMALMVIQRLLEAFHLLAPISSFLSPLMRAFGLPPKASYMWLVGNVLGISYGSAVMLEMEEKGLINRSEANDVNYHLVMSHSLLEDTIVLALTGVSVFWIITTRLLFAILVVWVRRFLTRIVSS